MLDPGQDGTSMEKKVLNIFLNLEKRNHIHKHITKLNLSGVTTTDPFEILEAEKTYYKNWYSSKQLNIACQESSQCFQQSQHSKIMKKFEKIM